MSASSYLATASLPPELAFVVQLEAHSPQTPVTFAGRVEHIASGNAARFSSLAELHAFMSVIDPSEATSLRRGPDRKP